MEPEVTVGRVVHYVDGDGNHRAAMVSKVWHKECVNLGVFAENGTVSGVTSALYSENTVVPYSWHWPERA